MLGPHSWTSGTLTLIAVKYIDGRLVPSRYLRVLWGEKIGYEDGLRRAGCYGKRRRKNGDWQISIQYGVRPKIDLFFVGL